MLTGANKITFVFWCPFLQYK